MQPISTGLRYSKRASRPTSATSPVFSSSPTRCSPLRSAPTEREINKASIVFTLPHSNGALSKVLTILSFYDINLSKIQSTPIVGREWEYRFYVDLTFDSLIRYHQAIEAVRPLIKDLRILGEYAEATITHA